MYMIWTQETVLLFPTCNSGTVGLHLNVAVPVWAGWLYASAIIVAKAISNFTIFDGWRTLVLGTRTNNRGFCDGGCDSEEKLVADSPMTEKLRSSHGQHATPQIALVHTVSAVTPFPLPF